MRLGRTTGPGRLLSQGGAHGRRRRFRASMTDREGARLARTRRRQWPSRSREGRCRPQPIKPETIRAGSNDRNRADARAPGRESIQCCKTLARHTPSLAKSYCDNCAFLSALKYLSSSSPNMRLRLALMSLSRRASRQFLTALLAAGLIVLVKAS